MISLTERLVDKSIEAFIMSLEIYNKPTIKYRIEGFSFFICNAWELMLKAYIIEKDGLDSIYFKNQLDRTISISQTIEQVFTNDKDPLRINLEKIIDLRNTSTHFITEDYEKIYAPLFQASVKNFSDKLLEFHSVDISTRIPQDFLTLRISFTEFDINEIRAKYPPALAEKLIFHNNDINVLSRNMNHNFAFSINHNLYITKKRKDADFEVSVSRDADAHGVIIKELRDPSTTHKFSYGNLVNYIQDELEKKKIPFEHTYSNGMIKNNFTTNDLNMFIRFYDMKQDETYSYKHIVGNYTHYTYSLNAATFILNEIKKNPRQIIQDLKNGLKQKK